MALLVLAYLAFVSLGLPDGVLGVAWPSMRDDFRLGQAALGAPLALVAASSFVSGLFAGRLMERVGVGRLLALSTVSVTLGVLAFASAPRFELLLLATPLVGLGSGAIDAVLNTYAAQHFGPRHMSWLHAAYAAGASAGPALMTATLVRGASWRVGYGQLGAFLGLLALAFVLTRNAWARDAATARALEAGGARDALRSRDAWLQIAVFFLYTGLESSAGQWSYTILTESRGLGTAAAGSWVAGYWGGLLAGRVLLGLVVARLGQVRLLRWATASAAGTAALFAFAPGRWSVAALPLFSFSLAPIFPGLMAETPRRLGARVAAHAVGFQVSAATLGVAVAPNVAGALATRVGLEAIGVSLVAGALAMGLLHEVLVRRTG